MANKTGRISLRVTPELHNDLTDIASTLGVDLNAMLNMMIRERYFDYKVRARTLESQADNLRELVKSKSQVDVTA